MRNSLIITVGFCPAWDVICKGEGLEWGQHKLISSTGPWPAGKAMNISRALSWMGEKSIAAGLWGRDDYRQMLKAMQPLMGLIKVKMTAVEGSTRRNITIVDVVRCREMHLRHRSELVSTKALRQLKTDLLAVVKRNSICVFAGLMPENAFLGDIIEIVEVCSRRGARIVLDTSGDALRKIIDAGDIWLIKPNVEELSELFGEVVADNPISLAKASRKLLDKVGMMLVSRGRKGAIVITKEGAWQGKCTGRRKVLSTIGCGDYLLAGFLKGLKDKSEVGAALKTAIKVATAKAWGWAEKKKWQQVNRQIKVKVRRV